MVVRSVKNRFGNYKVELIDDLYGDSWWDEIENGTYEPDTMALIGLFVNGNTDFIDVGAANGAMSILSANLGAKVLAIEAAPGIYGVAKTNFELNTFKHKIDIRNIAVSNCNSEIHFAAGRHNKVLSSIVFNSQDKFEESIQVVSLINLVEEFHISGRDLVFKIDIEGAEWKILKDLDVLECLKRHQARILLAIHPGFYRPYKRLPLGLTVVSKFFWQIHNLVETYFVFKKIESFACVQRTSLDRVKSPKKVSALMLGGYFEYLISFKS